LDLCQAVLGSFFIRAASGQFELDTPEQLLKLLATMVRNKLAKAARHERAERRDARRVEPGGVEDRQVAASGASPSQQIAAKDLLQEVHRRLSAEERRLVELRGQGRDWAGIAEEVGGRPDALRKQLARALERVGEQLGLEEFDQE
jgi:DNA-directed RNA polymerase specialized sigma24 family protein